MTAGPDVPILMFHSIAAEGPGPVTLHPAVFREQLSVLADAGAQGITVSDYVASTRAGRTLAKGTVVLTFDDGYRDFADVAFPCLLSYGWRCSVFLPVAPIDAERPWDCGDGHARRLLTWPVIEELAALGVEFGAHSVTHADLTTLGPEAAFHEIEHSGRRIHERTGTAVRGFAPPFGRTSPMLRREVIRHYDWSVGTGMGRASDASDVYDLPRLEMWYFRTVRRWRRYVARGWTPYFEFRRALRALREIA
jgi:peptidoglycan/xylan/chitin deacetylase (PgdA/CDA1 family)